jgi:antitoxin (DNA-binding transcriptional repressor) of toxin-antitoxin stability system
MRKVTIKELHQTTGTCVRRAGASKLPVLVTDHGKPVALLSNPSLVKPKRRKRTLLPEFKILMAKAPSGDTLEDLNAVRGNR